MEEGNDEKGSFFDRHYHTICFYTVIVLFVGYLVYSFYFPEPMPDCGYTDTGCEGDNRWGQ